jgi:NADPH-dependent 2,4-dienoyl-CoA reductase/sulfur reductase-like enzyme
MPYYIGRVVDDVRVLMVRTPEAFREKQGIDARILHRVAGIDLEGRKVRVEDLKTGKTWREPFDKLLIATGALPIRPHVPGIEAQGVYELSTLQSGIEVRQAVDRKNPQKVVVVGGGYIGLEVAENLALRGTDVSIVEKTPQVMNTLDADMAALINPSLEKAGIRLYLNESLQGLEVHSGEARGVATDRQTLPADMVILGLGVRPNTALAIEAGIPLGSTGGIKVDSRMQTEVEGIWAAGNCAEAFHLVSRRPFFIALGTVANKQGRIAGINLSGGRAVFPGALGTAMVKVCDLEVARTGLQEREIQQLGLPYITAKIEAQTRARYYPGTGGMTVKILAEKGSGRLLGGQIVGKEGAGKRIDVFAAALHAGFTVEEMIHLDLGYSPPFSGVWDPVLIAARQAANRA